jgi:CTP synthase (UTP-ammonia lyase)
MEPQRRKRIRAGVIGDPHPVVQGYGVIAEAIQHAAAALALQVETQWLPTAALPPAIDEELGLYDALWCGPAGPYENMDGALRAIRYARENRVPFLGTCAGFQHAAIEYARNVLGLVDADHAESNPQAPVAVIAPLSNPWIERTGAVVLDPASRAASFYRRTEVAERYRCNFGLNPEYLPSLHSGGLRVAGVDEEGTTAVLECRDHPFFVATLFMPEWQSRARQPHPLITAYLRAATTS